MTAGAAPPTRRRRRLRPVEVVEVRRKQGDADHLDHDFGEAA